VRDISVHRIPRSTSGDDWPLRPSHRGGMRRENHDFLKNGSSLFFGLDLERVDHIDRLDEIRFSARDPLQ
jgi:hypothetical protein